MQKTSKTRFIICDCPEKDKIVAQDMQRVVQAACEELGSIDAIILEGSYGRGEGAMIYQDGRWMPVNDYDLCIVTDKTVSKSSLENIKVKVLSVSDIWRVDLSTISRKGLRNLKPRMLNFDRKYGSQVIYGDAGVLGLIPEMRAESIPLFESEKELYTRMVGFIISFETNLLESEIAAETAYRLRQQLAKALVACANSILIMNGRYRTSCVEREQLLEEGAYFPPEAMKLVKAAFRFKAFPDRNPQTDLIGYYFQCRDLYIWCFGVLVKTMYKKNFASWTSYANAYLRSPRNISHRILGRLLRDKSHYRSLHLNIAQLFVIVGLESDGSVRAEEQSLAWNCLSCCCGEGDRASGWDGLRKLILKLRM